MRFTFCPTINSLNRWATSWLTLKVSSLPVSSRSVSMRFAGSTRVIARADLHLVGFRHGLLAAGDAVAAHTIAASSIVFVAVMVFPLYRHRSWCRHRVIEANAGPGIGAAHDNFSKEPGLRTHRRRDMTWAARDLVTAR